MNKERIIHLPVQEKYAQRLRKISRESYQPLMDAFCRAKIAVAGFSVQANYHTEEQYTTVSGNEVPIGSIIEKIKTEKMVFKSNMLDDIMPEYTGSMFVRNKSGDVKDVLDVAEKEGFAMDLDCTFLRHPSFVRYQGRNTNKHKLLLYVMKGASK